MGSMLGPCAAGAVCPPSSVASRTGFFSQLLLNPPFQLLAACPASAPFSKDCWAAQVQGQGSHLLEGARTGLRGPPQSEGCQHSVTPRSSSRQPSRTLIYPFVCLLEEALQP